LSWIITGNETWNHHFELQTKTQSVWLHYPTTLWKKFKATPSAGKVMAIVFWDAEGVILVVMPCGQAIKFYLYSQPLFFLTPCRCISVWFQPHKMMLKSTFSVMKHNQTQVRK
jgi:hypothetical protein